MSKDLKSAVRGNAEGAEGALTAIDGNLVLEEDRDFKGPLVVSGGVFGKDGKRYNLSVNGDLITQGSIVTGNLSAKNIRTPENLDALEVEASGHIIAGYIDVKSLSAGSGVVCWNLTSGGDVKTKVLSTGIANIQGKLWAEKITAEFVICEKLNLKEGGTLEAKSVAEGRSFGESKEWTPRRVKS